ncbi:VapE domain-containing protein [Prochlorococcus sp. MIT 1306]|uniref:VapE domain-containing protein n=1 Tax=Prochlorococcus sp. MIT 1306 TaxID=1799667 RepID=UPI0012E72243|nr:VapE domain-containing protein [Prochlorococcus sp. MIT 1306]
MSFFDSLRYPGNEVQGAAHHHAYPGEHARHFVFRNTRFKVLRNTMLSLPCGCSSIGRGLLMASLGSSLSEFVRQGEPQIYPSFEAVSAAQLPANQSLLHYWGSGWFENDKGKEVATPLNAGKALIRLREAIPSRSIRLNIVTGLIEVHSSPLEESDLETFYTEVQAQGWGITKEAVKDAVLRLALLNRYDPIQNYLNYVADSSAIEPVDIDSISTTYLGTNEPDFDQYMKIALLGAVKRRFEPGCQFDTVVTLDGDGGIGKSSVWINLASPDWHTSSDACNSSVICNTSQSGCKGARL